MSQTLFYFLSTTQRPLLSPTLNIVERLDFTHLKPRVPAGSFSLTHWQTSYRVENLQRQDATAKQDTLHPFVVQIQVERVECAEEEGMKIRSQTLCVGVNETSAGFLCSLQRLLLRILSSVELHYTRDLTPLVPNLG